MTFIQLTELTSGGDIIAIAPDSVLALVPFPRSSTYEGTKISLISRETFGVRETIAEIIELIRLAELKDFEIMEALMLGETEITGEFDADEDCPEEDE